ncbi:MAG: SDR family oxidoreductase [Burkholderiales bacterium]|nr:SDR family oxidoreductase [Burkholderiales bacterium]
MPTALIIGASRGIGRELALQYKAEGWRVLATARSADSLAALQAQGCEALPLDVNNLNDCAGLGWRLDDEKIDVAILNAGVYGARTTGLTSPQQDQFDEVMHTNVLAAMRLLPIILPLVENAQGKLAVISSSMGSISLRPNSAGWLYRASKAALNSVLKDVSLSTSKAICVALHPGWVKTEMGGAGADLDIADSVNRIRNVLAGLNPEHNGSFLDAEDGAKLSW